MKKAFTLIELLIVVAIIAILAAIAVPNFLEAQTRAKVSRAKADIRSLATALESYAVDNNKLPFDITLVDGMNPGLQYYWYMPYRVTTPIAYLSTGHIMDTFRQKRTTLPEVYMRYRFVNYALGQFNQAMGAGNVVPSYDEGTRYFGTWRVSSSGPDASAGPWSPISSWPLTGANFPRALVIYDPTNGTVSNGDIVRSQKEPDQRQMPYS